MNNPKQNRGRHRNNARRSNPSRQNFDSNGPGVRIRGNATQVYEKYIQLARDSQSSGDRVMAENMLQHAEHYYRILNENGGDRNSQRQSQQHSDQAQEPQPTIEASGEENSDNDSNSEAQVETVGDAASNDTGASPEDGDEQPQRPTRGRRTTRSTTPRTPRRRAPRKSAQDDNDSADGGDGQSNQPVQQENGAETTVSAD